MKELDCFLKLLGVLMMIFIIVALSRIGTELFRSANYQQQILHDLDRLSNNGVTVMEVRHYDD